MNVIKASDLPVDRSDPGVDALRLVNRERGAKTMTAGVATFEPGARIIRHTHPCEETVIILEGRATAHVNDREFQLSRYDTTIMPPGVVHCFSNDFDEPMTIAYFYPVMDARRDPVKKRRGTLHNESSESYR